MLITTLDNEEIIERVAALDIGKAEVTCCVRVPDEDHPGRRVQEVQAYPAMTRSVLRLPDYLAGLGVTRVVMEATATTGSRCSTCWRQPGSRPGW
jgi:transposase